MTEKKEQEKFSKRTSRIIYFVLWLGALSPVLVIAFLLLSQKEDNLPSVAMLDNPPELLASVVYADDGKTELGRYWKVNRTSVGYQDITPYVFDALISTEDERFMDHSGVDFEGLARAAVYMGKKGGASTITQQLAKLLFTLKQRDEDRQARAEGKAPRERRSGIMGRIDEKAQENIIATRLEKRYTKEEIITMYLNQFDFLYNAVGIENAAKVYFNKTPKELTKSEAACLVGMVKNPDLYNPRTYQIRDYKRKLSARKNVAPSAISQQEIAEARSADSLRIHQRRNQVLMQWLKNSNKNNEALKFKITQVEYDSLKNKPIIVDYQVVDHKEGIAPFFRESLRKDLKTLFAETDEKGKLKYAKADGTPYDIYEDGLRIYTTINIDLQEFAEASLVHHLKKDLQPEFSKNNKRTKEFPFQDAIKDDVKKTLMNSARKNSDRWRNLRDAGLSDAAILKTFDEPTPMSIFSWEGDIDTVLTPNDSIRYYKNYLHAGLISIEPQTGFVKAWVGGTNINHFAYDHVKQGKRQVGSTIKPFVYGTALAMGVAKPCTKFEDMPYCVDLMEPDGRFKGKWCPRGDIPVGKDVRWALANSNNPGTVAVMSMMGGYAGPQTIAKLLRDVEIEIRDEDIVPSMCLGVMDLSLYEMTAAQCIWANGGIYNRPTTVLRIEDRNGNVIYSAENHSKEVMNENVAYEVLNMMKGVVQYGTGGSLRPAWRPWGGLSQPMAGKTGTTQSNADGWYMGITPDLVTGVWVGAEDRAVRFRSMEWGQGARMALPIFGYYMQKAYKDKKLNLSQEDFIVPLGYDPEVYTCEPKTTVGPDVDFLK